MKRGLGLNLYIVYIIYPIFIYAGGNSLYIYIQYIQGRIQGEGASNPCIKDVLIFTLLNLEQRKVVKVHFLFL